MTATRDQSTAPNRLERRRFAAALIGFGVWVAFLTSMALRADPPDPEPGANPGVDGPRAPGHPEAR